MMGTMIKDYGLWNVNYTHTAIITKDATVQIEKIKKGIERNHPMTKALDLQPKTKLWMKMNGFRYMWVASDGSKVWYKE